MRAPPLSSEPAMETLARYMFLQVAITVTGAPTQAEVKKHRVLSSVPCIFYNTNMARKSFTFVRVGPVITRSSSASKKL